MGQKMALFVAAPRNWDGGGVILEYINIQGACEWFLLLLSNNKKNRGTEYIQRSEQKKLESTPVKTTGCSVMCAKKSPVAYQGVFFWVLWVLLGGAEGGPEAMISCLNLTLSAASASEVDDSSLAALCVERWLKFRRPRRLTRGEDKLRSNPGQGSIHETRSDASNPVCLGMCCS